jgi:hypothetical protein
MLQKTRHVTKRCAQYDFLQHGLIFKLFFTFLCVLRFLFMFCNFYVLWQFSLHTDKNYGLENRIKSTRGIQDDICLEFYLFFTL